MSRAFARLARTSAIVHHSTKDFYNPPTNGIYGTRELPTLRAWTNVNHVSADLVDGHPKLRLTCIWLAGQNRS